MKKLFFTLVFVLLASISHAAAIYVDGTLKSNCINTYRVGARDCLGSGNTAYTTIAAGVAALANGDTLYIRGGTYSLSSTVNIGLKDNITYSGYQNEIVVLNMNAQVSALTFVTSGTATNGVTIQNLEVNCNDFNASAFGASGGIDNAVTNLLLINNHVHNCAGIWIGAGTGITITRNRIHLNPVDHGVYGFMSNSVIANNLIYNMRAIIPNEPTSSCMQMAGGNNNLFVGNVCYDSAGPGVFIYHGGTSDISLTNSRVVNNIFHTTVDAAISNDFPGSPSGNQFDHNVFYNGNTGGQSSSATISDAYGRDGFTQTANVTGNPNFVSTSTPDFHVGAGSSAINAGANLTSLGNTYVNTDFTGAARPTTGNWTAGAYESASTILSPVVTINQPASCSGTAAACTITSAPNPVTLTGTLTSRGGTGAKVSWSCDRCGSGSVTGTTSWTSSTVTLLSGRNIITVSGTDTGGTGTAQIIITYAPTFPGNTMAGAWQFAEPSGTSATDSSDAGNTGQLFNGATRGQGKLGNGIVLDGISQYVRVSDANSLDVTQSVTLSAWVNPSTIRTDFRGIITKGGLPYGLFASAPSWQCPSTGAGSVLAYITANGSSPTYALCAPPLPIGQWTHVAMTYDNTAQQLRLYINGTEVSGSPLTASGYMERGTGALYIGADDQPDEFFQGIISTPRVYNFATPRTAGANSTPNASCGYTNYTTTVKNNYALASVVGDMNCIIIPAAPPLSIKVPSSATGLQVGAGATGLKFGQVPQ